MSEKKNEAIGALEQLKDKLAAIVDEMKGKAAPVAQEAREKAEEIRDKAAPVVDKIQDAAQGAVEKIQDGAERIGDFLDGEDPVPQVKNDMMDDLEEKVKVQRDEVIARAQEMQRILEKLMGGRKKK